MVTDPKPPNDSPPLIGRPPGYHSYLLRFWEERGEESPSTIWRFSLEDPSTDQRLGFASLDALVDWLKTKISYSTSVSD